jgi:hypothetical protein
MIIEKSQWSSNGNAINLSVPFILARQYGQLLLFFNHLSKHPPQNI